MDHTKRDDAPVQVLDGQEPHRLGLLPVHTLINPKVSVMQTSSMMNERQLQLSQLSEEQRHTSLDKISQTVQSTIS